MGTDRKIIHAPAGWRVEGTDEGSLLMRLEGLPEGVRRLLRLATAVPERKAASRNEAKGSFLSRVGAAAVTFDTSALAMIDEFIAETFVALVKMFGGSKSYILSLVVLLFPPSIDSGYEDVMDLRPPHLSPALARALR